MPAWLGTPSREYDNLPALDYMVIGDAIHTTATIGGDGGIAQTKGDFLAPTTADPNDFVPDFAGSGAAPDLSIPAGETTIVAPYMPFPSAAQPWSTLFVASLRLAVEAQPGSPRGLRTARLLRRAGRRASGQNTSQTDYTDASRVFA